MKKITKLLSVLMTAVMAVCAFSVCATADSIDKTAKSVDSGKKITFQMKHPKSLLAVNYYDYKVELSEKGTLKIVVNSPVQAMKLEVMDENGNTIEYSEATAASGTVYSNYYGSAAISWNKSVENSKVTLKYSSLSKGIYYIRIWAERHSDIKGKTSISFSYPQAEKTEESAKITSLTISLKKGDTLQLGTILSGEGDVKWSTSKKSVAAVSSKGKVTAKGKGTAVITAKTGDSSMKITIKVTE